MCHHFDTHPWDERTAEATSDDEDDSEEPVTPSFLKEGEATDVDLLTDGGDTDGDEE